MAVLFDLDGTILGTKRRKRDIRRECVEKLGAPEIDNQEYYNTFIKIISKGKIDSRVPIFEELLGDGELAERIAEEYRKRSLESTYVYPDAKEILEKLPKEMGLVTNGPRLVQWEKIKKFDLEKYFDSIVISGEVGESKPNPEIFDLALRPLNSNPKESFYVGNSPSQDILGAKNAGITSVLINRSGDPPGPKPDYEIADLRELMDLVNKKGRSTR